MQHARRGPRQAAELAALVLPSLLEHKGASVTHTLFSIAYHAQPNLEGELLHGLLLRAVSDLHSSEVGAKMEALKLLGLVLSCGGDASVWGGQPEDQLTSTFKLLNGIALMDSDRSVRQLAQQLYDAAFKNWTSS